MNRTDDGPVSFIEYIAIYSLEICVTIMTHIVLISQSIHSNNGIYCFAILVHSCMYSLVSRQIRNVEPVATLDPLLVNILFAI